MITAIWPSFKNFPNHLSASSGITSAGMLCYGIYFILQLPLLLLSPKKLRWVFVVKAVVAPATGFAVMGWAIKRGAGVVFSQPGKLHGSKLAWAFILGVNNTFGGYATYAINMNDFTRYARGPKDQWIMLIAIPVMYSIISLQGIYSAAAGQIVYGEFAWDPSQNFMKWDNRAAKFFAGLSFVFATIGMFQILVTLFLPVLFNQKKKIQEQTFLQILWLRQTTSRPCCLGLLTYGEEHSSLLSSVAGPSYRAFTSPWYFVLFFQLDRFFTDGA
jgi:cytosine/uracil/thiamine/allantoin permease